LREDKTINNLNKILDDTVFKYADRTALIYDRLYITYRQLHQAVHAVSGLIKDAGIGKGDKVAVMLPNVPEFVYSYFGVLKTGAVVVPLNTSSTPYELTYLLNNSDAKILITLTSQIKKYDEARDQLLSCRRVIAIDALNQNQELVAGKDQKDLPDIPENIFPEDPAVMVYTAGLTGKPLGAVLTHKNLCSQADVIQSTLQRTPDNVVLALIPLFHTFGASVNMLLAVRAGCSLVMMDRLTMDSLFSAIEREKISYIAAVPRLFLGMIFYEKASKFDVSSLKVCITGGAPIPPEFLPLFKEKFGVEAIEGYGLTEASPVCSFNMLDPAPKIGSIGIPIAGVEIKIVDDKGDELPRNTIGELVVRGDNVMQGYYKNEAATAEVIKNGWLHTGDLGRMDEDGYIFLTGLKKRMIISSGFNVYPQEVEAVMGMHPGIRAVYVTGKADVMRGEIVKAQIVLKEGHIADEKEIIRFCKTYLSGYKVPREVEFVSEIPNATNVKVE
jgi:long-chain acyl-CoA synthetase